MADRDESAPAVWDPTARDGAGGWVRRGDPSTQRLRTPAGGPSAAEDTKSAEDVEDTEGPAPGGRPYLPVSLDKPATAPPADPFATGPGTTPATGQGRPPAPADRPAPPADPFATGPGQPPAPAPRPAPTRESGVPMSAPTPPEPPTTTYRPGPAPAATPDHGRPTPTPAPAPAPQPSPPPPSAPGPGYPTTSAASAPAATPGYGHPTPTSQPNPPHPTPPGYGHPTAPPPAATPGGYAYPQPQPPGGYAYPPQPPGYGPGYGYPQPSPSHGAPQPGYGYPPPAAPEPSPRRGGRAALLVALVVVVAGGLGGGLVWALNIGGSGAADRTAGPTPGLSRSSGVQPPPSEGGDASPTPSAPASSPAADQAAARRQAKALDSLLDRNSGARRQVGNAVATVESCPDAASMQSAAQIFQQAAQQREQLIGELGTLDLSAVDGGAAAARLLRDAWQQSADADRAYGGWAQSVIRSGCPNGIAPRTADRDRADTISGQATRSKQSFVLTWNPIANRYGLAARTGDGI